MTRASTLVLCGPDADPEAIRSEFPEAVIEWLWLSHGHRRLRRWESILGSAGRHPIGGELNEVALQLRRPFLDLMAGLGRRECSLAWWTSRVAERNTMVSDLFLRCCQHALAVPQIATSQVVVADSAALLDALERHARAAGREVRQLDPPPRRYLPGAARRLLGFMLAVASQQFRAGPVGELDAVRGRPRILIHTPTDDRGIEPGRFSNRYFPGLADWLRERGAVVATVPHLINVAGSYRGEWRRLRQTGEPMLRAEGLYRPADYIAALRTALRQRKPLPGPIELEGHDVSGLFHEEQRRTWLDRGTLDALLLARLPRRLVAAGLAPDVWIDVFENMQLEKGVISGFRVASARTALVGFQHGAMYPLQLVNYVAAGEAEITPLPDRVVCNGMFFRDLLVDEGLPAERAHVGAALRYAYLRDEKGVDARQPTQQVLATLPLPMETSLELFDKLSEALGPGSRVGLRLHPMTTREQFLAELGSDLPAGYDFDDRAMADSIADAGVVVSTASTTAIEALVHGVPVVLVGRETELEHNPLAWQPALAPVARTADELRHEIDRALALDAGERAGLREQALKLLDGWFAPVTDAGLRAFVPDKAWARMSDR